MSGKLDSDPVFLGLTRPAMFMGVTYLWGMLETFICIIYFINSSSFWTFLYFAVAHITGLLICSKEPRMVELMMMASKTNFVCQNKNFHGGNSSFDVF